MRVLLLLFTRCLYESIPLVLCIFLIEISFTHKATLVSGVQHSDSISLYVMLCSQG